MANTDSQKDPDIPDLRSVPGSWPPDPIDGGPLSTAQNLAQAVYARRSEYTKPRKIRIKVGTWNVGANSCARDIGAWLADGKGVDQHFSRLELDSNKDVIETEQPTDFEGVKEQEARFSKIGKRETTIPLCDHGDVQAQEEIDLYVMGLQEVIDISSMTEAVKPYTDPGPARKYRDAIADALPEGYLLIAEQQLMGLLIFVFVSPKIATDVKSVITTSVGTGLMGYMGNKGATTAHVILGESMRLLFVNCHLAAGAEKNSLERRIWDAGQIVARTKLDNIEDPSGVPNLGENIGDEDVAFWFGDLNFRLESIPGDDVRRLLTLHTTNEYDTKLSKESSEDTETSESTTDKDCMSIQSDVSSKTSISKDDGEDDEAPYEVPADIDPASLQTTLDSLLPHDELAQVMKQRKAFHQGWKEGPIRFLPTYKYDIGSVARFDTSEKKRSPSWCDRILYRTRNDYTAFKKRMLEETEKEQKDAEMKARGLDKEDDHVIFEYNPDEDGEESDQEFGVQAMSTREGGENEIELESYVSHQRVLSSDHKPLDAVFSFTYQAVVPELKAKIHAEVTRILDRNENEGRPTITIVVDSTTKDVSSPDGVINFGHVQFATDSQRHITVANTGAVAATISLLDRPVAGLGEEGPTPPWLALLFDRPPDTPSRKRSKSKPDPNVNSDGPRAMPTGPAYTLEPGDTTNIDLTARITTIDLARDLNDGVIRLDDVLILRVKDGRDHFLPVQGEWVKTEYLPEETSKSEDSGSGKRGLFGIGGRRGGSSS
jgi:phosphatidylinositol-bisphosphatase